MPETFRRKTLAPMSALLATPWAPWKAPSCSTSWNRSPRRLMRWFRSQNWPALKVQIESSFNIGHIELHPFTPRAGHNPQSWRHHGQWHWRIWWSTATTRASRHVWCQQVWRRHPSAWQETKAEATKGQGREESHLLVSRSAHSWITLTQPFSDSLIIGLLSSIPGFREWSFYNRGDLAYPFLSVILCVPVWSLVEAAAVGIVLHWTRRCACLFLSLPQSSKSVPWRNFKKKEQRKTIVMSVDSEKHACQRQSCLGAQSCAGLCDRVPSSKLSLRTLQAPAEDAAKNLKSQRDKCEVPREILKQLWSPPAFFGTGGRGKKI